MAPGPLARTSFASAALDSLPDHVAILDAAGLIVAVNAAWRRFAEQNDGKGAILNEGADYLSVCDSARGADAATARAFADGIRAVLAGGMREFRLEYPCHSLQEERWFVGKVSSFTAAGRVHAVVTHHSITDRKKAELALEQREATFRAIFDQAAVGIARASLDGVLLQVNDRFCELLGFDREDIVGRPVHDFLHPDEHAEVAARIAALLRGPAPAYEREGRYVRRCGSIAWVSTSTAVVRRPDGTPDFLVAMLSDITEARQLEDELGRHRDHLEELVAERTVQLDEARSRAEAASAAKSAFLANMSHEIRTPMNGVLGMLEILEHSPLTAQQAEMISTVRQSGTALLSIIDGILELSRIEAGRMQIDSAPLRVEGVVRDVCAILGPSAARVGVDLEIAIGPDVPAVVVTDGLRLRQILLNLLGNAIKFSGGRPAVPGVVLVRVRTARLDPLILNFEVIDNGIGISTAAVASLFEPFTQVESSSTRRFGGTGLGLAVSRRLARLLGGEITVDSLPGHGSTFTLSLPAGAADAVDDTGPGGATASRPAPGPAPDRAAPMLLVEDDVVNREVIRRQLRLFELPVEIACNSREALALWRGGRFSLLLADLHMLETDGYALIDAIRRDEAARSAARCPIVALTANALRSDAERALARGFDDVLTKPLQLRQLADLLVRLRLLRAPAAAGIDFERKFEDSGDALDLSVLKRLIGDDDVAVREFLDLFVTTTRPLYDELHAAARAGDARQVAGIAHRLKSSARSIGAARLGALCADVEAAAKAADLPAVRAWLPRFFAECERVEAGIDSILTPDLGPRKG